MVFSDTSSLGGLVQDVDFICGTDSTSYPLKDKARNMNRHYYKAVTDILKADIRWQYDDSNLASLPTVLSTMTADTHEVALPAMLAIDAVEVKDAAGKWTRLQEFDMADLRATVTDFNTVSGLPTRYDLRGAYIWLEPAPAAAQVTLTNGLKFWVRREVDVFTDADTTQEPGFAEQFHRILSLGAAYDWLIVNDTQVKSDRILQQYEQLRQELRSFYSDHNKDADYKIRPIHRTADYE